MDGVCLNGKGFHARSPLQLKLLSCVYFASGNFHHHGRRQGYACIACIPEFFDEKSQLIVIISGGSLRPKRSELKDVVVIVIVVGVVMVGGRFIVVR